MEEKIDKGKTAERQDVLEIKLAKEDDLPTVWGIIDKSAQWLAGQDLSHWSKYYSEELVAKMIAKKKVFMGTKNGQPIATATYGSKPPWYYKEPGYGEKFTKTDEPVAYLTALAVSPGEHRQGYASRMMQLIESEAKKEGVKWLRLDCRAEVPGLVDFYEKRGFKKLGDKPVDEGEDGTYWLMEKNL